MICFWFEKQKRKKKYLAAILSKSFSKWTISAFKNLVSGSSASVFAPPKKEAKAEPCFAELIGGLFWGLRIMVIV